MTRFRPRGSRYDTGSATVVVIAAVLALALAFAAGVAAAAAVDAGARARAAADVAALHAAYEARELRALRRDVSPACGVARDVVERHTATMKRCEVDARGVVILEVTVGAISRTARAGTKEPGGDSG